MKSPYKRSLLNYHQMFILVYRNKGIRLHSFSSCKSTLGKVGITITPMDSSRAYVSYQ